MARALRFGTGRGAAGAPFAAQAKAPSGAERHRPDSRQGAVHLAFSNLRCSPVKNPRAPPAASSNRPGSCARRGAQSVLRELQTPSKGTREAKGHQAASRPPARARTQPQSWGGRSRCLSTGRLGRGTRRRRTRERRRPRRLLVTALRVTAASLCGTRRARETQWPAQPPATRALLGAHLSAWGAHAEAPRVERPHSGPRTNRAWMTRTPFPSGAPAPGRAKARSG